MYVGVNLTAIYQDDELTDKETFQVEFEKRTDQWRLRTADDTYWILVECGSGIQTNGNARYTTWLLLLFPLVVSQSVRRSKHALRESEARSGGE